MSSIVEQIKSKLSIADVVGSYIKLEKAGSNFKARCPFHNEKTASFFVSPSRETYHCFGCNKGGDSISFVEEIEGIDFRGALKILADRAGVRLTQADSSKDREHERLFSVLEDATVFFEGELAKNDLARKYLKDRGVHEKTAKDFRIGYAPNEWRVLSGALEKKGYSAEILEKAGLAIKSEKTKSTYGGSPDAQSAFRSYYDRFRGRVMFPIADSSGRIVGFSGRILPEISSLSGQGDAEKQAKYVNSPETAVFHKSRVLYGFDKAKQVIRKQNAAVLVEGQLDLVLSHQAGVSNTIASSGTALTTEHLVLIKRLTDTLVIAFDADEAGLAASKKGVDLALSLGFDVRVAELPEGTDPADLAKENPEDWKKRVENAKHVIDFYLKALSGKGYDMRTFRHKTSELVLPYVSKLQNNIDQAHFVGEIARALNIAPDPIWDELKKVSKNEAENLPRDMYKESPVTTPQAAQTRRQGIERKIQGILLWQEHISKPSIPVEEKKREYEMIVGKKDSKEGEILSQDKKNDLIFEAEIYYQDAKNLPEEIELLLANLEEEVLKEKLIRAMDELREAELKGDTARSMEILKKCQEISKKLNDIVKK